MGVPHRHPRTPVPRRWLMTDERMGDGLWPALERLPRGGGIVFRHYATEAGERGRMFAKVARIARRRGLILVGAGIARGDGAHGRSARKLAGIRTWPAHDRAEAVAGKRAGAEILFVSPVFATRSHPGARPLGPLRTAAIGRGLGMPVIALGGMNARQFKRLQGLGFYGWAAIDAWL